MSLMDILRTALNALRGNWMRSALTSLGVIIGIAAVIVMVSIGQGTNKRSTNLCPALARNVWTSAAPAAWAVAHVLPRGAAGR